MWSLSVTINIIKDSDEEKGRKNGGGAGTRTPDTGIMIPLLYQLSYTAPGQLEAYDTVLPPFCQEKP